jgi:hypothetical protein
VAQALQSGGNAHLTIANLLQELLNLRSIHIP